ncbi:MAG TPA: DUF1947 domain-containing protein, partial [Acidilobales archaeon]|nr:DUF1947 domain-containing protein [Acidilobales archaeon]
MRYHALRRKEVKRFRELICVKYGGLCDIAKAFNEGVIYYLDDLKLLVFDGLPSIIIMDDELIPTLVIVKKAGLNSLPYAVVDEGAVKHLINGADVMVPGITEVSEFNVGDIVAVWEPTKTSPIVIGKALLSSSDI